MSPEPFTVGERPIPVAGAGRRAAGAAVFSAAVLLAVVGCGDAVAGGTGSATRPAATAPLVPSRLATPLGVAHSSTGSSPRASSEFVVITVTKTVVVDGNIYFAPPASGAEPRISAATAFATARHAWGDPQGTATPELVLTSLTNDGQGQLLPGGGIRPFDVNRLVWAVVDSGATCSSAGPAGAPHPTYHDCVYISFVDARTGQAGGSMDEGGPGVSAPEFGSSSSARPEKGS